MSSNLVPVWVPVIVALVTALIGFAGVLVTQGIANRRADKQWDRERSQEDQRWAREKEIRSEARIDRRRQELAQAIAEFASTVASLRRTELKRAKERIAGIPE